MKRFNNIYLFLGLAFTACSKDTLVLPVSGDNAETGTIDVIAKPTDVTLVGEYDYKFSVKWPALSENVKKIVISYTDNGETKTKEFTDFTKDAEIQTSQAKEYDFTITSYSADNLASKSRTVKVINKGYKIEQMITSALSSVLDGTTEVVIPNDFALPVKLTVKSPWLNGETKTQVLQSNEDIRATFDALDGTHKYTIELEDELGRKVSREMAYEFDFIVNVEASSVFNVTNLSVSNNAKTNAAKVTVNYPTSTGNASKEVLNTNSLTFPAIKSTSAQTVTYSYVDEKGRTATGSVNYTYNPILEVLNTAAAKTGWSAKVSSNHEGDGGGAPALIDGNVETFWHSPWGGTILPWPHTATISFGKDLMLTKVILNIRHNNGTAAPKEFDLQTSEDGVTFTTHQSFTNTVSTAKAVVSFTITTPVKTKHVRLSFKNGFNTTWISLGEISFEGYQS